MYVQSQKQSFLYSIVKIYSFAFTFFKEHFYIGFVKKELFGAQNFSE